MVSAFYDDQVSLLVYDQGESQHDMKLSLCEVCFCVMSCGLCSLCVQTDFWCNVSD